MSATTETEDKPKILSYYVKRGTGTVFNFKTAPDHKASDGSTIRITRIGTDECDFQVGVYFRIDDDRCFVANIDAEIPRRAQNYFMSRLPVEEHGDKLTAFVLARLQRLIGADWTPDNRARKSLVLICPDVYSYGESYGHGPAGECSMSMVGDYLIHAIQKFLRMKWDTSYPEENCWRGGFVKDHVSGELNFLMVGDPGETEEGEMVEEVDFPGEIESWDFELGEDEEWFVKDV